MSSAPRPRTPRSQLDEPTFPGPWGVGLLAGTGLLPCHSSMIKQHGANYAQRHTLLPKHLLPLHIYHHGATALGRERTGRTRDKSSSLHAFFPRRINRYVAATIDKVTCRYHARYPRT